MHDVFHIINTINTELPQYITLFGKKIYILLFIVIFAKTAYVVLTFLPGDATLFAGGTIAASGELHFHILFVLFFLATVAGDAQNYLIGKLVGQLHKSKTSFSINKFISPHAINKTDAFLTQYGKLAIMFSRFVPLLSTTLPFISGFTGYSFKRFISYNAPGAAIWSFTWVGAGYLIGNIAWVQRHMFISLLCITLLSLVPPAIAFIIEYTKKVTTATEVTES
ncbi:DedA family protein [Pullulanibacillus camelliae]|uniref:DedA family protein n=1 Tax=Pullulanibacillus camelliae TaxID=1707096 RepID=UPI0016659113|nr:VTT domain-containing protein [Pullulanibacillus camelliae]